MSGGKNARRQCVALEASPSVMVELDAMPEDGRLYGMMQLHGARMVVELVPVRMEDGLQVGTTAVADSRLSGICHEFDAGALQTVTIKGQDYVPIIIPGDL